MRLPRSLPLIIAITAAAAAAAEGSAFAQQPVADLEVFVTAPERSAAGTDVTFTITVSNGGPDPSDTVVLTNNVPMGTTFISATQNSGPAFSCTPPAFESPSGSIDCTVFSLGNGTTASFSFVFHIDPATMPGTYITDVGKVSAATFDPSDENDTRSAVTQTPPPPAADMMVTKVGPSGANPNADVTYTIDLVNGGPGGATSVQLDDTIPGDMTIVSVTQLGGPALVCSSGLGGTITCTAATFAAGATASLMVVTHIPADRPDGTMYQNFASVTSAFDPTVENNDATTLLCVQADLCAAGACNVNVAIVCPVADQCHTQGTCNPTTGICAPNPARTDGATCNDGNACTQLDTCQVGVCIGTNPVVCPSPDQCHDQVTCNPTTGACPADPPKADGAACSDGNGCTQTDTCQAGLCSGGNPVVCPAADQCHDQGTCNPVTGACTPSLAKAGGTACSDGDACTRNDTCQNGICIGSDPVVCPVADQCHDQGTCNVATGVCAPNPPRSNGAACSDGNPCTQGDSCQAGGCQGGTPLNCDDGIDCSLDSCDIVAGCLHTTSACDAGAPDAAGNDAPADSAPTDSAPLDGVRADSAPADSAPDGLADAATDTARPAGDARADTQKADAQADTQRADAAAAASSGGGCGCRTAGGEGITPLWAGLALLGLIAVVRVRRRRPGVTCPQSCHTPHAGCQPPHPG
jgi:uncharacterized repeat protein (TIGR01451 family)/MYXO-CTERM domain-containing protein